MTPEDSDLWKRVTATVAPLVRPLAPFFGRSSGLPMPLVAPAEPPAAPPPAAGIYVAASLDLHGYTLSDAFHETRDYVRFARAAGRKSVIVITGKSGPIRREFPFWLEGHSCVKKLEERSGGGAFCVYLKKP